MRKLTTLIASIATASMIAGSLALAGPVSAKSLTPTARYHSTFKVGLAIAYTANDDGFNQLAIEGLNNAKKHLGVTVNTTVGDPSQASILETYASQGYNLVVAVGILWGQAIYTAATNYPNTKFAIMDGVALNGNTPAQLNNVSSQFFSTEQPGYLMGVIAGGVEKTISHNHNKIGVVGAIKGVPFVDNMMCGYYEGAKSVNKHIKLVDDYAGTFTDESKGKSLADKQIGEGADILFQVADLTGLGYLHEAQNKHKYGIGFAMNQQNLGSYVLSSGLIGVNIAIYRQIAATKNGHYSHGAHYNTLANGVLNYARGLHHVSNGLKNTLSSDYHKIIKGKLKVKASCSLPQ